MSSTNLQSSRNTAPAEMAGAAQGIAPHRLVRSYWALETDCVAEDAVRCELVSAPNSLLTGKLTGNFAESGHPPRFLCLIGARIQWLAAEFPTQRNSEFSNTYQRILFGEQGKSSQTTARPAELRSDAVHAPSQSAKPTCPLCLQ